MKKWLDVFNEMTIFEKMDYIKMSDIEKLEESHEIYMKNQLKMIDEISKKLNLKKVRENLDELYKSYGV